MIATVPMMDAHRIEVVSVETSPRSLRTPVTSTTSPRATEKYQANFILGKPTMWPDCSVDRLGGDHHEVGWVCGLGHRERFDRTAFARDLYE